MSLRSVYFADARLTTADLAMYSVVMRQRSRPLYGAKPRSKGM